LLATTSAAHLAYLGSDVTPRVIPVGCWWTGEEFVISTAITSPKVDSLSVRPDVALVIDGGDSPGGARALSVRGRASVETVDGVVEEYLMAGRKSVGDEAAAAFEAERFLGAGPERPMLSMQRAYAVHTHGTVTGKFVGSIARRSRDGREPPPTRKAQVRALPAGRAFLYPKTHPY
jgi:hypothetical protein